jgi:hypothetical protein
MGMKDKMMDFMMGKMSKEDKEEMMDKMMEKFFADFSPEEKQKMMEEMMPKMMEGVNMMEMMPKMMMSMMGAQDDDVHNGRRRGRMRSDGDDVSYEGKRRGKRGLHDAQNDDGDDAQMCRNDASQCAFGEEN